MKGITLFSLFNLALRHILALILAAVIFAAGAYAYCEYVAVPRYSSTGSLLVSNGAVEKDTDVIVEDGEEDSKLQNTDVVASINFMSTATDLLKQNSVYKMLAQKMNDQKTNNKYYYGQLMGMSKVSRREENSLYIDITFTATSPEEAIALVNGYLEVAPEAFKAKNLSVNVSGETVDSASKIYPQTSITITLFAILGAGVAYGIFLILYLLNSTIVGERDFKERFDIPVIGTIPDFASAKSKKYSKYYKKNAKYGYYSYYERGNR